VITTLLSKSRAAHDAYRRAQHLQRNDLVLSALLEARRFRLEADALDPDRKDPAFRTEPAPFQHAALLAFYEQAIASKTAGLVAAPLGAPVQPRGPRG